MGDAYWEETIAVLQGAEPLLDKPKLSEKHLTKPPFRYLHDVISGVQASTGFAPGLFQGEELDARTIQGNKDAKVLYLTKIINVVSFVLGEPVPAKPLKIVAGYEPENTNTFLVMLGHAARKDNGASAVARVLAGEAPDTSGGGARPAPPPAAKPAPPRPPPEDADSKGGEPTPPPSEEKQRRSRRDGDGERKSRPKDEDGGNSRHRPKEDDSIMAAPPPAAAPAPRDDGAAAMHAKIGRPQSARKGPPKLAQTAASGPPPPGAAGGARPGTASRQGPGSASPGIAAAPAIALFSEGAQMDDDEVEVVHERAPVAVGRATTDEQGVLVRDILEAEQKLKKEREEGEEGGEESTGIVLKRLGKRGGGSGGAAATGGAAGGMGIKVNDHAGLRELVQKLTQSSHPLAKSMDYLQEDLENMAKEYRFWVTERRVFQEKLSEEQRMAGEEGRVDSQLADLDGQIRQVRDRTIGLKAQVLRNDELLEKLLGMAVSGGR